MSPETCLKAENISKSFNSQVALKDVSLDLKHFQFNLLLGANSSGKSTLLRILAGLIKSETGQVNYLGRKASEIPKIELAQTYSYLGHETQLYAHLSVSENIALRAKLLSKDYTSDVLSLWGLEKHYKKRVLELSRGLQQRTALACCFLAESKIILLDEPSTGLDEAGINILVEKITSRISSGASIIVATHDLAHFKNLANRVILLKEGSILGDSSQSTSPEELVQKYRELNR